MSECQEKALRECCHGIEQAWIGVSSTEKTNTKGDLARAMTKSKSTTQTVTNRCVSRKGNDLCCWEVFQCQRPHRVSRIKAQSSSGKGSRGIRLMIIKLRKYNEIGELLIENRTAGFQGHVRPGGICN